MQCPACACQVRHILCEKHSRVMEALELIKGGQKFEEVGMRDGCMVVLWWWVGRSGQW